MSRKIDALVAEHVMNITDITTNGYGEYFYCGPHDMETFLPDYSTDIAAAWEVVEKLKDEFYDIFTIQYVGPPGHKNEYWEAGSFDYNYGDADFVSSQAAKSKTAPMAICLAALKLKGIEL